MDPATISAVVTVVIAVVKGIMSATETAAANAVADANERISASSADAANTTRAARNNLTGAQANAGRLAQWLGQAEVIGAAADAQAATLQNFFAAQRNEQAGNFEQAIAMSEQLGAQAAARGSEATISTAADQVAMATELRQARQLQLNKSNAATAEYAASKRVGGIVDQLYGRMDNTFIMETFDRNVDTAKVFAKQPWTAGFIRGFVGAGGGSAIGGLIGAGQDTGKTDTGEDSNQTNLAIGGSQSYDEATSNAQASFSWNTEGTYYSINDESIWGP